VAQAYFSERHQETQIREKSTSRYDQGKEKGSVIQIMLRPRSSWKKPLLFNVFATVHFFST